MTPPADVVLSEGFCPLGHGHLGDPNNERVWARFCTTCRRYWNQTERGVVGYLGSSGVYVYDTLDGPARYVPLDEVVL